MIKVMFTVGIIALLGIVLLTVINGDDLRSLVCVDFTSSGNNVNRCEKMIATFVPVLLLIPLSVIYHFLRFQTLSSKRKILIGSLTYPLYVGLALLIDGMCESSWCDIGADAPLGFLLIIFFPLLPVFIFSLLTYRMHDEVFLAWRNFSYWWIPLTIFLVLITPEGNSVIMSWGKEVPAIGMSAFYVLISTIIILRTWWKTRKNIMPTV